MRRACERFAVFTALLILEQTAIAGSLRLGQRLIAFDLPQAFAHKNIAIHQINIESFSASLRNIAAEHKEHFSQINSKCVKAVEETRGAMEQQVKQNVNAISTAFQSFPSSLPKLEVPFKHVDKAASTLQKAAQSFYTRFTFRPSEKIQECLSVANSAADHSPLGYKDSSRLTGAIAKDIDLVNRKLSQRVLEVMNKPDWTDFAHKDGVLVQRRESADIPLNGFPAGVGPVVPKGTGGKFLCIKATAVIDAPVADVYHLFLSNDHVLDYNELCSECKDVGWLDPSTKVTWAASKKFGPFSSRDFVTRCHYRRFGEGTYLMSTMSENLPCQEFRQKGLLRDYCRMDVHLAGYLLRDLGAGRTEFSMISLANPGGALDSSVGAMISNVLCASGPVKMVNALRRIAPRVGGPAAAAAAAGRQPTAARGPAVVAGAAAAAAAAARRRAEGVLAVA